MIFLLWHFRLVVFFAIEYNEVVVVGHLRVESGERRGEPAKRKCAAVIIVSLVEVGNLGILAGSARLLHKK